MSKATITVDGKAIEAAAGDNLLEVAINNNIDIPHMCYDPRLEPFGSCRLCFIEISGRPDPVPACSVSISDGLEVVTNSGAIRQLRKSALELLMAEHCGDCVPPCQMACPADIDIQGFVSYLRNNMPDAAARLIREKMPLPSICGRVCPRFCEHKCRGHLLDTPVDICGLKRYSGDYWLNELSGQTPQAVPRSGKRVAIVGGGPAGLTAAYYLAQEGHELVLYDGDTHLGGMLRYGIPEYRLPKELLDKEIKVITDMCHEVRLGQMLGHDFTLEQLKEEYDAVFLGVGCQQATELGLENSDLPGIYTGIGFLRDVIAGKAPQLGERVAVIGGGNTAMDAARTAVRLGVKDVMVVYRRAREQMPAEPIEIEEAIEEGVQFHFLTNPNAFIGNDKIEAVECVRMELGEPDSSGRRRPVEVPGSEFTMPVDNVIMAIGQKVDEDLAKDLPLEKTRWGTLDSCEETFTTSIPGVYAAGDCVSGAATVVEAVGTARKAAISIDHYLRGMEPPRHKPFIISRGELEDLDASEFADVQRGERVEQPHLSVEERKSSFSEYSLPLSGEQSQCEASRCLECGCQDAHNCVLRDMASEYQMDETLFGVCDKRYTVNESHPHIHHDPDKCILCGKCVLICQEVVGVSAWGFVNRGYDTVVKPSLDRPLSDVCISCGQCVYACPTGALTLDLPWIEKGPWRTEKVVETTCVQCDINCPLHLHLAGGTLLRATSPLRNPVSQGGLCEKGSFNYMPVFSSERISKPGIRINGKVKSVEWDEALELAAEKLSEIAGRQRESLAVLAAADLTNEEQYLVQKLARQVLKTNEVHSLRPLSPEVLAAGDVTLEEVENSDMAVVVDTDLVMNYLLVAQRVRKMLKKGGKLAVVGKEPTLLSYDADIWLKLRGEQLLKDVGNNGPGASQLLDALRQAERPVIIIPGEGLSAKEHRLLKDFAKSVAAKVLYVHQGGNARGQLMMGVTPEMLPGQKQAANQAGNHVPSGIKGALVIGDCQQLPAWLNTDESFIVAISSSEVKGADIVLPLALPVESEGSVINCEGRVQHLIPAFPAPGGKNNREIIGKLMELMGTKTDDSLTAVAGEIKEETGLDFTC